MRGQGAKEMKRRRDVNNQDGLRSAVCNNAVGGAPIESCSLNDERMRVIWWTRVELKGE